MQTRISRWQNVDLRAVRLDESANDGFKRSWIMLMPYGEYDHPQYGKLSFTKAKLAEFKDNFDAKVRHIDIALDQDHDGGKATGWLEELALKDGGLWGRVRWTPLGQQLLHDQIYRYFSPEFGTFTDPETGRKFEHVIIGGALTNRPFLKDMPAVKLKAAFEKPGQYTKSDRAKIAPEDFAGPGKSFPIVTQQDVHDAARLIGHAANPDAVKARIKSIAKRKGFSLPDAWANESDDSSDSKAASEKDDADMATAKSRKLAEEDETLLTADEVQDETTEEADATAADDEETETAEDKESEEDAADESSEDEEADESDSEDDSDSDAEAEAEEADADDEEPPATLSEMLALADGGSKAKSGAAKGKTAAKAKGKAGSGNADDAEDAADAGADEDQEMMDDGSGADEEYDDVHIPGELEIPSKGKTAAKSAKSAPVKKLVKASAKQMAEPEVPSETVRLADENKRLSEQLAEAQATIKALREESFKASVSKRLSEMSKHIRLSEGVDSDFALPRSFKSLYERYMLDEGIRLSDEALDRLNGLILHALKVGTVPLNSLANRIERGEIISMDDRRPKPRGGRRDDEIRTEEARRIALSEHHALLDDLDYETKLSIFRRVRETLPGTMPGQSGEPVA